MQKCLVFKDSIGGVLRVKQLTSIFLIVATMLSVGIGLAHAGEPSLEEKEACRAYSTSAGKLVYINRLNGMSEKEALDGITNADAKAKAERDKELAENIDQIKRDARLPQATRKGNPNTPSKANAQVTIDRAKEAIESAEKDKKQALELKKNTVGEKRMQQIAEENIANADKTIAENNDKIAKASEDIAAADKESAKVPEEREQRVAAQIEAAKAAARAKDEEAKKHNDPIGAQFSISLIKRIYALNNPASESQLQKLSYEECYKAYASSHKK